MSDSNAQQPLPEQGLLLASASPRRLQLLQQMGLPVATRAMDVDERVVADESPEEYVARMSELKCESACVQYRQWLQPSSSGPAPERVIVAADTIVVAAGAILGKPAGSAAATAMLQALSGTIHQVLTSVSLARADQRRSALSCAEVRFRELSAAEIQAYVANGEGADKAGSYGIQGIGGIFAEYISGSYSAVVGLPIATVEMLLVDLGIDTWRLRTDT